MKVGIIGTGYIGLTEGLCFASLGQHVICYDIIKEKIELLASNIIRRLFIHAFSKRGFQIFQN